MYKTGIFLRENKNRFLCEVFIDGAIEICYTSSSSKLKHFITLENKEVILIPNIGKKTRTQYRLFATKLDSTYVLLDLRHINYLLFDLTEAEIIENKRTGIILKEKNIEGIVKTDLFFSGDERIAFEAKGLFSYEDEAVLPGIRVERAEKQLLGYKKLLDIGINVRYCIFILNPNTNSIALDYSFKVFADAFLNCLLSGMEIRIYKVLWDGGFHCIRSKSIEKNFIEGITK